MNRIKHLFFFSSISLFNIVLINQKNNSNNNNKIINSNNSNTNPVTITIGNQTIPFSKSKRIDLCNSFWNMYKCLLLLILLLTVGFAILMGFFIEKTYHFDKLTDVTKEVNIEKSEIHTIFSYKYNSKKLLFLGTLLVKAGQKFGGKGGSYFYGSLTKNITYYHYLSGIITSINEEGNFLGSLQVLYSSSQDNGSLIKSKIYGNYGRKPTNAQSFILDKDERINKVQGKLINRTLIIADNSQLVLLIGEVQFFTTKGRVSPSLDQEDGVKFIEQFEGYTLGYVAGRSGLYIDQLQFFWYRTDAVQ